MTEVYRKAITQGELEYVRDLTMELVPGFCIYGLDPNEALVSGDGNCLAKGAIAGTLIELLYNVDASAYYSLKKHGMRQIANTFLGEKEVQEIGHFGILVPWEDHKETYSDENGILSIDFGYDATAGELYRKVDKVDITEFNDFEDLALVREDGQIVGTDLADSYQMLVQDWHDASDQYLDKIGHVRVNHSKLFVSLNTVLDAKADSDRLRHPSSIVRGISGIVIPELDI